MFAWQWHLNALAGWKAGLYKLRPTWLPPYDSKFVEVCKW